ncbi:MAG: hypothetical protein NVSMB16_01300 [Acidimicrobiales bacterium]
MTSHLPTHTPMRNRQERQKADTDEWSDVRTWLSAVIERVDTHDDDPAASVIVHFGDHEPGVQ